MAEFKNSDSFNMGYIQYIQETKSIEQLISEVELDQWNDGYAAFSKGELRLKNIENSSVKTLLTEKTKLEDLDGYLMELGLWKNDGTQFEELSIERVDGSFLYQYWALNTDKTLESKCELCYWQKVEVARRTYIKTFDGQTLNCMEVVIPHKRLHFYITNYIGSKI